MEADFKDYISLQEATKHCLYSQQYLSLRARQGKLKAVKFGRNWVTKKDWVEEYSRRYGSKVLMPILTKEEKVLPPKNLPVIESEIITALKVSLPLALVCLFSGAVIVYGENSFGNVFGSLSSWAGEVTSPFGFLAKEGVESFEMVWSQVNVFADKFASVYYQTGSASEIFKEYGNWTLDKLVNISDLFK